MKKTTLLGIGTAAILVLSIINLAAGPKPTAHADSEGTNWRLLVSGLVNNQLDLSLAEIQALPKTSVSASIFCVDRPTILVSQGNWTGISLSLLLDRAGVTPEAIKVAFYAKDGYSTDLTVETARRSDVILAYEKDSSPLSDGLRLVVPGKWGYKWISQLSSIVLVDYDFKGYWESRGYSDIADTTESGLPNGGVPQIPNLAPPIPKPIVPTSPDPTVPPNQSSSPDSPTSSPLSPDDSPAAPSPATYAKTSTATSTLLIIVSTVLVAFFALFLRKRKQ
jgi:hypothetical protein